MTTGIAIATVVVYVVAVFNTILAIKTARR